MKKLIFILPLVILFACNKKNKIEISGSVPEVKNEYIFLDELDINTTIPLDSAKIKKNGKFQFKVLTKEQNYYQLRISKNNFITLLTSPGEKIIVTADRQYLPGGYEVKGSEGSLLIKKLDGKLLKTRHKIDSLITIFRENEDKPGFDSLKFVLDEAYQKVIMEQRRFTIGFLLKNMSSLACIKALYQKIDSNMYVLNENKDLQYLKIVADSLKVYFPDSKHTKALIADLDLGLRRYSSLRLTKLIQNYGSENMDVSLPNPQGDTIFLSSQRGKHVLLCFWASVNTASVNENIQLKNIYSKYNKKRFEIYQISLDTNKVSWQKAIRFDELPWINVIEINSIGSHVARLFNIQKLPSNFLINPDGVIISKDLHGKALQIKLSQLFD